MKLSIPCSDAPWVLLDPWVHSLMLLGVESSCFVSQNSLKNLQCFSPYSIHGHVNEWVKQHFNPFAVTQEEKRKTIKQPPSKDSKKQRKPICLWHGWDKVKLWNALSFLLLRARRELPWKPEDRCSRNFDTCLTGPHSSFSPLWEMVIGDWCYQTA